MSAHTPLPPPRQDDQLINLIILIVFVKQRTYLARPPPLSRQTSKGPKNIKFYKWLNRLRPDEIGRPNPCVSSKKRPTPPIAPFTERDSTASWGLSSHSSLSSHISTALCVTDGTFTEHYLLAYERRLRKNSAVRVIRPALSGSGHPPRRPYGIMQVPARPSFNFS
jgi:hypothetical protein